MKQNSKIKIALFLFFAVIAFIAMKFIISNQNFDFAVKETLEPSYTLSADDSSLIAHKYLDKIKVQLEFRTRNKKPVSFLQFDQKYFLLIYRIDVSTDKSLPEITQIDFKNTERSIGYAYHPIKNTAFEFQYRAGAFPRISQIFLTICCDGLEKTVNTDSLIGYYSVCTNFSIRYKATDPIDVHFNGEPSWTNKNSQVPLNMSLLKRGNTVYLMIMTSVKKESINKNLLVDFLNGNL